MAAVLIDIGYQATLSQPAAHPALAWISLASYALGFITLAAAARRRRRLDGLVAGGFVLAFALQIAIRVIAQSPADQYGTDALAFNHYSAQVLLEGRDPYTASMEPAYREFDVPATVYTTTVENGLVLSQSYPALSFLFYVPFVLLHLRSMLFVELGFAAVAMLLVAFIARRGYKALAVLVFFASAEYVSFAFGSVTDVAWLPFMILVAAFWNSESVIAPIALGLACATKQNPWFVVPFALVHWAYIRDRVPVVRNAALALLAFLAPNLPFILWNPGAWLRGVLFPMLSGAIPNGSGIVQLVTSNALPFPVAWLSWIWPAVFLAGVAIYALRYRGTGWMPFVWPAVALFFSPRSLQNYFAYWPIVFVAYLVSGNGYGAEAGVRGAPVPVRRALAVAALCACVLVAAALATPAIFRPLRGMQIARVRFDAATGLVRALSLSVERPAGEVRGYRFAVDTSQNGSVFWNVARVTRAGRGSATVELRAPGVPAEVPVSEDHGIQVAAYAASGDVVAYTPSWMPAKAAIASMSALHMVCAQSRFSALPVAVPVAWKYAGGDFAAGTVACAARGMRDGILRFRVLRPHGDAWATAAVSQLVAPGSRTVSFWLKPGADSSAGPLPTHLFGVSIVDGLDRQFYVVIDSALHAPEFLSSGSFRYYVVPGRIGHWNHVRVDARDLRGFYAAPYTPVIFAVMDAIHARDAQRATDDEFGGFGARP